MERGINESKKRCMERERDEKEREGIYDKKERCRVREIGEKQLRTNNTFRMSRFLRCMERER